MQETVKFIVSEINSLCGLPVALTVPCRGDRAGFEPTVAPILHFAFCELCHALKVIMQRIRDGKSGFF